MGVSESATKSLNKNPFNNKKPNKSHSITPKEQSKNSTEIHAAAYVSENFIKNNGRLGRSLGCPSLPKKDYDKVVHKIKNGSLLFIYYPEDYYLKNSILANFTAL